MAKKIRLHDSNYCLLCGAPATDTHHCVGGKNRQNSEAEGLTVRLCRNCHDRLTFQDTDLEDLLKRFAQCAFEFKYESEGHRLWMERFGRNYL